MLNNNLMKENKNTISHNKNFKENFEILKKEYIGQLSLSTCEKEEMYFKFKEILSFYELENDLKFNTEFSEHDIIINPCRPIDKYALLGLMNV
jgi:hypothetical protein